jgi:uncharacterized protein (TIGR02145 family)
MSGRIGPLPIPIPTVVIGTQEWMLRNLDVTKYRNGDDIPEITDQTQWNNLTTGAWCYYNNDSANGAIYGKLYNWYAVNDPRGLAPVGYHVPSLAEYIILRDYLGGSSAAGGALKETGTTHWTAPNTGATNSSGFTLLGSGARTTFFTWLNQYSDSWTSTDGGSGRSFVYASYNSTTLSNTNTSPTKGAAVRCIKD